MNIVKKKKQAGFTLIELLLYVALVSIFISGAILFAWDVIYGQVRSSIQRDVAYNLRFASKRISYELRNAASVISTTSNQICLSSNTIAYNPTLIYQSGNELRIAWGGGSGDCTSMTNDAALVAPNLTVNTFAVTDLSTGNSTNIQFSLTVSSDGVRDEWDFSETYQTSVEVR
jgi:prepilin-type N-terminal cleavage/methylation domain-containing protein